MKKIVLIGDSIRIGYDAYVREKLAGKAEVLSPEENGRFAQYVYRYVGEWKDNLKNGHGIFYYSSGDRFEGEFSNSLKHGHGVFYSKSGDVYEGEWLNDMRCGIGIVTLASGKKMRQKWNNEKLISEEIL